MPFHGKKALFFDLDGTLIDSVPELAEALNSMLKSLNRTTFSESTIRYWVGNGAEVLVTRALLGEADISNHTLSSEEIEEALAIFLEAYARCSAHGAHLYPQVKETLEVLKKRGYRLAIITNKPTRFVAPILEKLQIIDLFETFLGGDALSQKKPHPLPLLHLCEVLCIEAEEAVMIGDSSNDILAAKAAKIESIGVSYGYNYGQPIVDYSPECVIDHFELLLELL